MKEEISIKVNIADVVYPLKVAVQDEENVRKAARLINDKIKAYRTDYQIADKANLLSMVALQFASELLQFEARKLTEDEEIKRNILDINNLIEEQLVR